MADAVTSVLEQTRAVDEVIVVDDGSTDGTVEALARFGDGVRIVRQANRGVAAARNTGVESAGTTWVALLDADDWWLPQKTERMTSAVAQAPDAVLAYAGRYIHDEATDRRTPAPLVRRSGRVYHPLLAQNFMPTSSVLVRRDAYLEAGGMDPTLVTCEDWDLWIRLARRHPVVCVPERLCVYRKHAGGISQHDGPWPDGREPAAGVARMRHDERRVLERAFQADPDLPRRAQARAWAGHHYRCGMDAYAAGDPAEARRLFSAALAQAWHGGAARRYVQTLLGKRVLGLARRTDLS